MEACKSDVCEDLFSQIQLHLLLISVLGIEAFYFKGSLSMAFQLMAKPVCGARPSQYQHAIVININ